MRKLRWMCAIVCAAALCAGTASAAVKNSDREAAIESKAAAESEAVISKAGEKNAAESKASESKVDSKSESGKAAESKADDSKAEESKAAESKAAETKPADGKDKAQDDAAKKSGESLDDLFRNWENRRDRETQGRDDRFPITGREEGDRPDFGGSDEKPEDGEFDKDIDDMREVTVCGSGSVKVVPDMAEFVFGVTSTDKDAAWAQKKNAESIDKVIAKLEELGVDEKSITTSGYSIYPQYDYSSDKQELTGYEVRTTLTVKDQKIEAAGKIISECVEAGINDFDYINFLSSEYEEAYQEALTQAVKAARKKAEVLAAAAGMKLGDVIMMTEGYQDTSASYTRTKGTAAMALDASAADMSLMAGESEISATVTVAYEMR
jgi:uncharacterized protein